MEVPVTPRLRSARCAVDYSGFLDSVLTGMKLALTQESVAPALWPVLTEDYPQTREGIFDTKYDVVLFNVLESCLGGTSPDGGRKPKSPLVREQKPHPTKEGYLLTTYGWWEDAVVQFEILSKNNKNANDRTMWFHRFMMFYGHALQFFQAYGVQNFRFIKRLEDRKVKDFGQDLFSRRLLYGIRLEFLYQAEIKTLESFHITLHSSGDPLGEVDSFDSPALPN